MGEFTGGQIRVHHVNVVILSFEIGRGHIYGVGFLLKHNKSCGLRPAGSTYVCSIFDVSALADRQFWDLRGMGIFLQARLNSVNVVQISHIGVPVGSHTKMLGLHI